MEQLGGGDDFALLKLTQWIQSDSDGTGSSFVAVVIEQVTFDIAESAVTIDFVETQREEMVWVSTGLGAASSLLTGLAASILICVKMAGKYYGVAKMTSTSV